MVVVLPDPFQEMGVWRNSIEIQQSAPPPRSRPEVKNGGSSVPEMVRQSSSRCETIQKEVS